MSKTAKQSFTISGPAATLLQNVIGEQLLGFCPTGYVGQSCPSVAFARKLNEVYQAISGNEHPYWAAFKDRSDMDERAISLNSRRNASIVAAEVDAPAPAPQRTEPVTISLSARAAEMLSGELNYRMRGFDPNGYAGVYHPSLKQAELLNEAYRALSGSDHENWVENKDHPHMDECAELNNAQLAPKFQRGATHGPVPEQPAPVSHVMLALPPGFHAEEEPAKSKAGR